MRIRNATSGGGGRSAREVTCPFVKTEKSVLIFLGGGGGEISLCLSIYGLNCSFKTMLRACSKKNRVGIVPANNV